MSWLWIALLACAVLVLIAAEWPRLEGRLGLAGRTPRRRRPRRRQRKTHLKVVESDSDDFAASVERDLALLPTFEEREDDAGRRG